MKGDPTVIAGLQTAIDIESSLALRYFMAASESQGRGLAIADKLWKLQGQCECYMSELLMRLFFLEGTPRLAPQAASPNLDVTAMFEALVGEEYNAVEKYAQLTRQAYDAGDMSNFHYYQHLTKWHREGDDKKKGHIKWLEKQLWQINEVGSEEAYVAEQI